MSFLLINSDLCNEENKIPSSVSDCINSLSEEEKKNSFKVYCCYSKSDLNVQAFCESLTQDQYDFIQDYIKYRKLFLGEVNLSIDCHSLNIKLGLFNIILLFFIFYIII